MAAPMVDTQRTLWVLRNQPIKRKLMTVILLTSGVVLALACGAFLSYELLTFRQTMVRHLSTLAQVIAANSTAALAFDNHGDAREVLSALAAERHIVAAGLHDNTGTLFARYPDAAPADGWPRHRERDGYEFERSHFVLQEPVVNANRRLGTLVLKSDLGAMYERGNGVTQNAAEAVKWYRKAAEQGHAAAQFNLALILAKGRGVAADPAEAAQAYLYLMRGGYTTGQVLLVDGGDFVV